MDLIDPTSLDDYLAVGGYRALQQLSEQMSPEAVIRRWTALVCGAGGAAAFPPAGNGASAGRRPER